MLVLGIDPGTATVGWGLVSCKGTDETCFEVTCEGWGVIQTPKNLEQSDRLKVIYDEIQKLAWDTKPDEVAIEEIFFSNNARTAMSVAESRGVIILAARTYFLERTPVYSYKPNTVKKTVTGNGRASKKEVQEKIALVFKLEGEIPQDDAADALAIAFTHLFQRHLKHL